jgi:hypothetical protein
VDINWKGTPNGFEVELGEGALTLRVFYHDGWRSCINDRVVRSTYPDADEAKKATVNWAREKLRMMEAELRYLEHPIVG